LWQEQTPSTNGDLYHFLVLISCGGVLEKTISKSDYAKNAYKRDFIVANLKSLL
jgi:hypothetical protein